MKQREKLLLAIVLGICALFAAGYGVRAIVLGPLHEWDRKSDALRAKLETLRGERRAYFTAEERVKGFVERTFALTEDQVSAESGERLTRIIIQSGLSESDFTRTPMG